MATIRKPGYGRKRVPLSWRIAKKTARWLKKNVTLENMVMVCVLAFIVWVLASWFNVASYNIGNPGWEVPSWNIFVVFKKPV